MNTATNKSSPRITELDGLRGSAILFVLIWHYFYFFPSSEHHPTGVVRHIYLLFERFIAIGWSGVDLFFVLSGFLIGGILLDAKGSLNYFRAFYIRRFYRIIPLYYVWIAGYFLALGALSLASARHASVAQEPGTWVILTHFLFIQNLGFVNYSGIATAWFISTWSLAVEEQFYLIAPLLIRALSSRVLPFLLCSVVVGAPVMRLWVHYYWHPAMSLDAAYVLMPCRADALALGVLAAYLTRNRSFRAFLFERSQILSAIWIVFLAGVVALTVWSPDQHSIAMISAGYTWLGFFYVVTLLLALVNRAGPIASAMRLRWLRRLGRISYCVYIIHQAVILFVLRFLPSFVMSSTLLRTAVAPIVAIGITLAVAELSWKFFENKLIARGHSYSYAATKAEFPQRAVKLPA